MNDFMRELLYIVLIICIPYLAALVKKLIGEATDAIAAPVSKTKKPKSASAKSGMPSLMPLTP